MFRFANTLINLLKVDAAHAIEPAKVGGLDAGSRCQFTILVDDVDAVCRPHLGNRSAIAAIERMTLNFIDASLVDALQGNWSIHAWNRNSGQKLQLATSRLPDGTYPGDLALSFPVAGDGYAAWSQPTSASSTDVRVYRFATGQYVSLDSGRVTSPVIAAHYLAWAKLSGNDMEPGLSFADAQTLKAVATPRELVGVHPAHREASPVGFIYLAGSPGYLVWITYRSDPTGNESSMGVDDLIARKITQFTSSTEVLQFPLLAGRYLVWFGATVNEVADLRTGSVIHIELPSGIAAGGDTIVVSKQAPGTKGVVTDTTLSIIHPSTLSYLPRCGA